MIQSPSELDLSMDWAHNLKIVDIWLRSSSLYISLKVDILDSKKFGNFLKLLLPTVTKCQRTGYTDLINFIYFILYAEQFYEALN